MADTLDSLLVPSGVAATDLEQPYVVYFLTARKARYPVKIGISGRHGFRHRLQSLQTAMPYDLVLLYLCPCDVFQFESQIHSALAVNRLRRAWKGCRRTTITHPHFGPDPVEVFAIDVSEPLQRLWHT